MEPDAIMPGSLFLAAGEPWPLDTLFKLSILTPKIRMVKTLNLLQQGS